MTARELPRIGVADALVRMSHQVQREFADVSRGFDLTPQQAQLLCRLAAAPMGMTELGCALNLEKSSLTGLVDRVERRGLTRRVRDERDRRMLRVELTEDGAALARVVHDAIVEHLDALVARMADADRAALAAALPPLIALDGRG
jgi:DNA-binding MarR family transcriptional regulator